MLGWVHCHTMSSASCARNYYLQNDFTASIFNLFQSLFDTRDYVVGYNTLLSRTMFVSNLDQIFGIYSVEGAIEGSLAEEIDLLDVRDMAGKGISFAIPIKNRLIKGNGAGRVRNWNFQPTDLA